MEIRRHNSKGEGQLGLIIFIAFLAAVGYFGWKYFWPKDKPAQAEQPKALDANAGARAGSPAAAAVQGAEAAGELLGSGR